MASVLCLLAYLILIPTINSSYNPCAGLEGYSAHGTSCFRYYTERDTQPQAETKCQIDGGHLASIHSEDEHTFIKGFTTEDAWIGVLKTGVNLTLTWTDGTMMDYTKWYGDEPNSPNQCARMSSSCDYEWADKSCTKEYTYVCRVEGLTNQGKQTSFESSFVRLSWTPISHDPSAAPLMTVLVRSHLDCARRCSSEATCTLFTVRIKDGHNLCELLSSNATPNALDSSTESYMKT